MAQKPLMEVCAGRLQELADKYSKSDNVELRALISELKKLEGHEHTMWLIWHDGYRCGVKETSEYTKKGGKFYDTQGDKETQNPPC